MVPRILFLAGLLAAAPAAVAELSPTDAPGSEVSAVDVGAGSVEDVAAWLDETGFSDLKKAFSKNVIDGPALREITEDELRELGVKKIGPRKRFGRLLCEALPDCERPDIPAREGEINMTAYTVDDVGEWLAAEGFGDARRAFAAQLVDGAALFDLNEDELKVDLGVSKLGPRRRFARKLCAVMPGCRNPRRADEVAAWSTADVASWLHEQGLAKYQKAFAKHEVDGLTLPDITEEDLKADLGVVEIGLRKRFRLQLCKLHPAFCQRDRESEASSGADAYGVGGMDLSQYIQRAQAYLQQRTEKGGDPELAKMLGNLFGDAGEGGEGKGKASIDYAKLLNQLYARQEAKKAQAAADVAADAGGEADEEPVRATVSPDGAAAPEA